MVIAAAIYNNLNHPMRTALLNCYALSLNLERYGGKFDRLFRQFDANSRLSYEQLRAYQGERLRLLIRHAYENVPYYRDVMNGLRLRPEDIREPEHLARLPVLTREDVKAHYQRLKAVNLPWGGTRHGRTSGTTGSPLQFLWDIGVCVAHHAADWRQKRWAGLEFGERFISLQGRQIVPAGQVGPPFWVMNRVHNQLFMSSFHLKEENLCHYVDKIARFQPQALEGYPSSLYILARYMERHDIRIPVPAILTSSETLLDSHRELLEDRFACKVFDFYGMAERVVYGAECSRHCGKHLNMDYGIAELLDRHDAPVAQGAYGRLVATSLWNFAMPLIRYRTSDVTRMSAAGCACGCNFPLVDNVTTKADDIIKLRNGRLIPPSILTHPFKPIRNVRMSQIVQEDYDQVKVFVVASAGFSAREEHQLYAGMKERLGEEVSVEIIKTDDLPKSSSGKFRWVISRVPFQ